MRHDPIEFGRMGLAARAAEDRVARLATRMAHRSRQAANERVVDVIDEAFARYSGANSRVTRIDQTCNVASVETPAEASTSNAPAHRAPINRELIAELTAQLDTLDRQRDQLAQLLRSIDASPLAH